MAAPLEFWLVREDRFGGHNCRGFHPLLQGYLCCRSLFSLPPGCRGGSSPGSGDILQGRQDPAWRGAGIAEAVPREALLGRAQGAAGLRAHITSCQDMSRSWLSALALLKTGETALCKMSSSTFKSWLAKPSNRLGNSSAFQTYLSVCDLQRGSLAWTESRFMVGWEIFI